ncbi:GGDEF domain-containing protein [Novosphingobium aureum]|nr:GGDEF domain-containing protein [Novosphingobium aureum]
MAMRFYSATTFLFPRHYERRLLSVCFVAVHIPLVAAIVYQAVTGRWETTTLVVLLVATLFGTAAGLASIRALLAPIEEATEMLRAVQSGERISHMPRGGGDLVGRLLEGVAAAANESATRIELLTDEAGRDSLTSLRNRRGFTEVARKLLVHETEAAVAMLDIDHFKQVNDRLGHARGDALLMVFAQRINALLRRSDICARWGGEEFIVLFPDTALEEAAQVMERLRATIAADAELPGTQRPVTFSCGIASLHRYAELDDATRRADEALYVAKQAGRNRVEIARQALPA